MPSDLTRPLWKQLLLRRLKMLGVLVLLIVVLGGGSYLLAPQWLMQLQAWSEASQAGLSQHSVEADGVHWSYYDGGKDDGATLVLLHGYGADKSDWLPVAKVLARNFRVIIPDLPGWGHSSLPEGADGGPQAQAGRLAGFVDALHLQGFTLVGQAMGGAVAGLYAARYPMHVAGLVLVDSAGLGGKKNAFEQQATHGGNPFAFTSRAGYERAAHLLYLDPPWVPGRFIDVLAARNKQHQAFMQQVFQALHRPGQGLLDAHLGELKMPVIGIWCRQDKVSDLSALNTLRSGLTHAASIGATVINGCGHRPEQEKPEATARIIAGFAVVH